MAVLQPFHERRRVIAHPIAEFRTPVVAIAAQALLLDALRDEVPFLQLVNVGLEYRRCGRLGVFAANFPLHVLMQGLRLVFRTEPGKCTQDRYILNGAFARKHVAERERTCRKPFLRLIHKR